MPPCTVIPVLGYKDTGKMIEWLCRVIGFTVRWRAGNHRAQLEYEGGVVVVTEQASMSGMASPLTGHSIMVRVIDIDRHFEQALHQGAEIIQHPQDFPYGERQYTLLDPGGYVWTFSQSIADLSPEDWGGTTGDSPGI